jgi:hypothetical protein
MTSNNNQGNNIQSGDPEESLIPANTIPIQTNVEPSALQGDVVSNSQINTLQPVEQTGHHGDDEHFGNVQTEGHPASKGKTASLNIQQQQGHNKPIQMS